MTDTREYWISAEKSGALRRWAVTIVEEFSLPRRPITATYVVAARSAAAAEDIARANSAGSRAELTPLRKRTLRVVRTKAEPDYIQASPTDDVRWYEAASM